MNTYNHEISNAIEELEANLSQTARVEDWAKLMGYTCPKKFARSFMRQYEVRPINILTYIRLKSISMQLRKNVMSNFEIARSHGINDEIALNKFVNYHLGCSPSCLKRFGEEQLNRKFEEFNKTSRFGKSGRKIIK